MRILLPVLLLSLSATATRSDVLDYAQAEIGDAIVTSIVTAQDLAKDIKWNPATQKLPLTPDRAAQSAETYAADTLSKKLPGVATWKASRSALCWVGSQMKPFYRVDLDFIKKGPSGGSGGGRQITVFVRLDSKVIPLSITIAGMNREHLKGQNGGGPINKESFPPHHGNSNASDRTSAREARSKLSGQ